MIPRDDQYIYHNLKPEGASTYNHLHLPSPLQIEISVHYKPHKAPGFKMIVSLSLCTEQLRLCVVGNLGVFGCFPWT